VATDRREIVYDLTEQQLRDMVSHAVGDTLTRLGLDVTEPTELQRDFQHLRDWRQTTETLKRRSLVAIVSTLIAGALAALWLGVKAVLNAE
jgi:hypothetical protein